MLASAMPEDEGRLILVSNRLPITIKKSMDSDQYDLKPSSGGLVSGLQGLLKSMPFVWYGWAGLELPDEHKPSVCQRLRDDHSAVPIFFPDHLANKHYNGFSNEVLWPMLHYHPGGATFDESAFQAYKKVNEIFADQLIRDLRSGDILWIHDYHLMLLPGLVRDRLKYTELEGVKIGWFLHTPFPSSEVYRTLPTRKIILEGLLAADLLGFHTWDYTKHFLGACEHLLDTRTAPNAIEYNGHRTSVGAFPIGIDPDKFTETMQKATTQAKIDYYRDRFRGAKVIIGCDRLDYIKGVPHKLHAFRRFLEDHPEQVGQIHLVQIAIPSREDVEEYQMLKCQINELVGSINGQFGKIDFNPVHLKHTSVSPEDLIALFTVADACLVSSTRDGMNLVAYEYIACQRDRHGVLVLSEFAGCAQSFSNGAIICNPWDMGDVSQGLYEAVTMGADERLARHQELYNYVTQYTSAWWGAAFLDQLDKTVTSPHSATSETDRRPMHASMSRRLVTNILEEDTDPGAPRKTVSFETTVKDYGAS